MSERIYRTVDDRVVAGVCGGFAVRLGLDPSLVRIAVAVITLISGIFPGLVLYVIAAAVIPEEPTGFAGRSPSPAPPGPGAIPGWAAPPTGAATPADAADAGQPAWPPAAASGPDWPSAAGDPGSAGWPPMDTTGGASTPAGAPSWATTPTGTPTGPATPAASGRTGSRGADGRLAGVIGGLVLVALGLWFLVRDRLDIDWGIVWAAGLVAIGVVIVIAAFRPRR